ncbi:hypothetical protein QBC37DRAFT_392416 [Rhypophila decipiens]|uniref:Rhodopsin domain-containing protein n=1 Tax=Rhypophila decipiens TaxID=261697 RepID=A0AAN6XVY2_9PEZI|nr:hypothetical protein QBC37DRAFT_392416 [Rhypophila decipiens]
MEKPRQALGPTFLENNFLETHATGVSIAAWFLASTFLIFYLSGQTVKFVMLRRLRTDDYLLLIATKSYMISQLFGFGLTVSYWFAASNGLGNQPQTISETGLDGISKSLYAADMLYISTICCVKLSLLAFTRQLTIDDTQRRGILYLAAFVALLAVSADLASAFQCYKTGSQRWWKLSDPPVSGNGHDDDDRNQCFGRSAFWIVFTTFDMLTDLCIMLVPTAMVWMVNIPKKDKVTVMGCFAPRLLVMVAAASRLAYLLPAIGSGSPATGKSSNGLWVSVICTQLQVCLSISSACVPSVKPLFQAIEAGVWQADDLRRRGLSLEDLHSRGYLKSAAAASESSDLVMTGNNYGDFGVRDMALRARYAGRGEVLV